MVSFALLLLSALCYCSSSSSSSSMENAEHHQSVLYPIKDLKAKCGTSQKLKLLSGRHRDLFAPYLHFALVGRPCG
jgi:hypothetical protein